MIDVEADADALADRVVVVARHQREHLAPALEAQRVEDLGAAERLVHDFGLGRRVVVVHHVVGSQQHLEVARQVLGGVTEQREIRLKPNRRNLRLITEPAGVNVLIDGTLVGTSFGTLPPELQSTAKEAGLDPARASAPLIVPYVEQGQHQVRFEKECYEPQIRSIHRPRREAT